MEKSITRAGAKRAVCAMERPESIKKARWVGVKALLEAIADCYPNAYPSQATLARRTGRSVRSIQGYQADAVAAGLLLVEVDGGVPGRNRTWSKTNRYHIISDAKLASMSDAEPAHKGSFGTTYVVPQSQASPLPSEEACPVPPAAARMASWKEPEREVGTNKAPSARKQAARPRAKDLIVSSGVRIPGTIKPPANDPKWLLVTKHFVAEWQDMVDQTKRDDHLRQVRSVDSLRHCKRYLQAHFFGPEALTPTDVGKVRSMVSMFVKDCYSGKVRIKDGQTAWMAFTGAWGRDNRQAGVDEGKRARETYVPVEDRK